MTFIFCGSYLSVVDTITAINEEQGECLILSADASIIKLFSELYSPRNVFLLPANKIVFSKPLSVIRSIKGELKKMRELYSRLFQYNPNKIIFSFTGTNGIASWLIMKFSETANVYYKPECNTDHLKPGYNVRIQLKCIFYNCLYGRCFAQKKNTWRNFIGVSDRFIKSVKAKPYSTNIDMRHVGEVLSRKYSNLKDVKILVLICDKVNVEDSYYRNKISSLLGELVKYVEPSDIALKAHPKNKQTPNINIPQGCILYPNYLPANLLLLRCHAIISYESAALSEATDIGKKSISLLDMLKPIDERRAVARKNYLAMRTNGSVRFPKTIDALLGEVGVNNGKGVESL